MQKWKSMILLDISEGLDEGGLNEENCTHLEGKVLKENRTGMASEGETVDEDLGG